MELRGGIAIVTGASRGIGTYLSDHLARRGVDLALAARSAEPLEEVAARARSRGVRAIAVATDVSDPDDLENLVAATTRDLGPPSLLVNNAGIERYSEFATKDPEEVEATIRTNLIAPLRLTQLVLPHMIERRRGHIVNISSLAGKSAVPYNVDYSTSKHALVGFSWSLRAELRPYGIGVSVVCPGFVKEAGMFHDRNPDDRAPAIAGAIDPDTVARATMRAIEKDKAEVLLSASPIGRVVDVFAALSPDLVMAVGRRAGLYGFLRKQADTAKKT